MSAPRAHVTVSTRDLRSALLAVRVHLSTAEGESILNRIRLTFHPDGHVYVTATDRYTAGLAIVSIWEDRCAYGDLVDVDLFAEDAKNILDLFKPSKDIDDEKLAVLVTSTELVITDASGLFPDASKSVHLPLTGACTYPAVDRMMAAAVAKARQLTIADATPVVAASPQLTRFAAAGVAYSAPVEISHTSEARHALLIQVGESFLGLLMPLRPDEAGRVVSAGYLRNWARRLPDPLPDPVPMPDLDTTHTVDLTDLDNPEHPETP